MQCTHVGFVHELAFLKNWFNFAKMTERFDAFNICIEHWSHARTFHDENKKIINFRRSLFQISMISPQQKSLNVTICKIYSEPKCMRLHMMSVCYAILIGLCGYSSQMETILSYAFCLKTWIINYYTQYRFTAASDHEEFLIILIIMQKKKIRNAAHKYVRNIDWNTIPTMRNALYTWLTSFSLRFFFWLEIK